MKKIIYSALFVLSALVVNAQTPAVIFLQADATVDSYEFLVMTRSDLSNFSTRDAGICANGIFRSNEADVQSYSGLTDVPAGTIVQVRYDNTGTADNNVTDGRVMKVSNYNALLQVSGGGEQIIAYSGTGVEGFNCSGSGTNTFLGGIDWGNNGWTNGATTAGDSKAPGTPLDFAYPGAFNKVQYTNSVVGNALTIGTNILNPTSWTGTTTGDGVISLKNILFNESNYSSGTAGVTPALTSITLNLSTLTFSGTNADTRYAVIIRNGGSPTLPADRYTCYTGIAPTVLGSPSPAALVSGQTANDFCGTIAQGIGQIVYFDYTLPASLTITGLTQNTSYQYAVVACNGNGYTANFSTTAYTGTVSTTSPANTSVEVSSGSLSATVNENVVNVLVPIDITNPSPGVATTVDVVITGGTGSAADVNNFTFQTITFPAGTSTSQQLSIQVTDDILIEGTETLIFTLQNVSGGQGTATIGGNNTFTLTITDNDAVLPNTEVNFTTVPTSVIEDVGQVGVVLTINNPSQSTATTVDVVISSGTGSAADINNYTTQTITFPAGSGTIQPMSIIVTDDAIFENAETIEFAIRNITGGQGSPTIGADSTFTLTIIDNDIPALVINEINYNPSESGGSPDAQYEFVEIYNGETITVDLSGYTFSQGIVYTFPTNTTIDPSEYIIVAVNAATYSGQGYVVYQWASGDLDNSGETVEIKTAGNLVVDYVSYDEVAPWPTQPNNSGPSLQLIATNLDNTLPQNWYGNGPKNGTPGHVNSPVGIAENLLQNSIKIYSAGTTVYVNTEKQFAANYTLNLTDATGRTVGTYSNITGNKMIDASHLPYGLYFVQCTSNGYTFVQKVQIGY